MNNTSEFQKRYSLSPRKFWKKMISRLIPNIILVTFLIGFLFAITIFYNSDNSVFRVILNGIFEFIFVFLIINLIYGIYVNAYIKRYYYDCGDQFITIKKGVFAPSEIHVMYQKIQDVYVDQDILDRIIGLYDVHIASATVTSGIEAHIDGVEQKNAEAIKDFLLNKIQGKSSATLNQSLPSQNTEAIKFQSDKKISSETYPISGAWMKSSIITATFASLFFSLVVGGFLFFILFPIILIIWIFSIKIWKKNYYFEFLPEYILLKTGILGRQEKHLPYKSIQNTMVSQRVIERMFGIFTVKIENAAANNIVNNNRRQFMIGGSDNGISIVGQPYDKAQELNEILNKITSSQSNPGSMGL